MSGKLIMPKQTGRFDAFISSLRLFYESYKRGEDWYENDRFKISIQKLLPYLSQGAKDGPYLVKQSELVRYYGLAEYDYSSRVGRSHITKTGIAFYEAYLSGNHRDEINIIMHQILTLSFGRNNSAIKSSDADIDPPKLFIKAAMDLGGITIHQFAYLLYLTNDLDIDYHDALVEVQKSSSGIFLVPPELSNKYKDAKFYLLLSELGIIKKIKDDCYILSEYVFNNYTYDIGIMSIYNKQPKQINSLKNQSVQQIMKHLNDATLDDLDQEAISQATGYNLNSEDFIRQNERKPEKGSGEKSNRYKTNPRIAKTAIACADFKCQCNPSHETFRKKNGDIYMEAHHLIPMAAQKDFDKNLDRIENIVSLCPTCHAAIHNGDAKTRYEHVLRLYKLKASELKKAGFSITAEELFNLYYK